MLLVWVFMIVSGFVWLAEGSCFYVPQPPRNAYGCVDERGEVIGRGKTRYDLDSCFRCTCKRGYLDCCGIGYNAGTMRVEGCTLKKLPRCEYTFVSNVDGISECANWTQN
ncbi:uncharacterized protein LOC125658543 [Ostrea edulis]|uniref:uncharacterized protein LOC125658543 n=1 Tax=Ostrea edulis TaxID=37623 RepID=UPI002095AD83|nr:uncharacterized protein LOC125658543 [Ostrea edulis]